MVLIGPASSIYGFLTLGTLIWLFHTAWFVESPATQTLVILVIRTAAPPWRSLPSRALSVGVLPCVGIGILLPFRPVGSGLGFVAPPATFFLFLLVMVVSYPALVEVMKRWFYRRYAQGV